MRRLRDIPHGAELGGRRASTPWSVRREALGGAAACLLRLPSGGAGRRPLAWVGLSQPFILPPSVGCYTRRLVLGGVLKLGFTTALPPEPPEVVARHP